MKLQGSNGESITVPKGMEEEVYKAQAEGRLHELVETLRPSAKKGGMLKRKDGSYSRRGLWDNIRAKAAANRRSGKKGKKPTAEMLRQEARIRAKQAAGGVVFKGYVTEQPMGDAVPFHTSTIGEPETYGKGGYTVKRSSARKGKTHVVIGPDGTKKYFGDSKLGQHPGNPKRKKAFYARHAKNLKGNPYFRAFARATWDDGGKLRLSDNMYDLGVMPYGMGGHIQEGPMSHLYAPHTGESVDLMYADGGYTLNPAVYGPNGNINPYTGMINGPDTPAYNERYDLGGDIGAGLTGIVGGALGTVPLVGGILQQGVNSLGEKIQGPLSDQEKAIRGFGSAAGGIGAGLATGNIGGAISQGGSGLSQGISAMSPESAAAQGIAQGLNVAGTLGGMAAGMGAFGNAGAGNALKFNEAIKGTRFGNTYGALNKASAFNPLMSFAQNASNIKMADGGQSGLVPINVEGADFSEGSGPDAKKGELLVLNGKIYKNYVGRPPHPAEGQDPMGNDDAPEGLIVIPKARTKEYLEAGLIKRKQMERSIVSQQQDREMKKSKQMGDGGYYSFGMGEMGMGYGGSAGSPMGNPDRISPETFDDMMTYKKGGWIQKATASIKRRGTEGVCTGSKFGSSSCPPGSRRYNLAKTFRKMAKARKHELGGYTENPDSTFAANQWIKYRNNPDYLRGVFNTGMENPDVMSGITGATEYMKNKVVLTNPEVARFAKYGIPQHLENSLSPYDLSRIEKARNYKPSKRHGGFVDPVTGSDRVMYRNGAEIGASVMSTPFDPDILTDSKYNDIEFSNLVDSRGQITGKFPLGRRGSSGNLDAYLGMTRGLSRDLDKEYLNSAGIPMGYTMTDWEETSSPVAGIGISGGVNDPRNPRGFTMEGTKGGVGVSYEDNKLSPYLSGTVRGNYNFGRSRGKYDQPFTVYAGGDAAIRPFRRNDSYGMMSRPAEANEKLSGATNMNYYAGLQGNFGGTQPFVQYGKNVMTGQPVTQFGIKQRLSRAMGGNVNPNLSYGRAIVNRGKFGSGGPTNVDRSLVYQGMNERAMAQDGLMLGLEPAAGSFDYYTGPGSLASWGSSAGAMPSAPTKTDFGWKGTPYLSPTDVPVIKMTPYTPKLKVNTDVTLKQQSYPTSNFSDFLNSSESDSPLMIGPDGNAYSINPNASQSDLDRFFKNSAQGIQDPRSNTDLDKAMKLYGILGGAGALARFGEGLLSKSEEYKRMPLRRQAAELLNPREALADQGRTAAGYKYALRQTGPNQRLGLTTLAGKDYAARAGIYGQYDNVNAQIRNAEREALVRDQLALMQQDQMAQMYDAQGRAARRNMTREGITDLVGTAGNFANMMAQKQYLDKMAAAGNIS